PVFQMTHLVETHSGKATRDENELAQKVSLALGRNGLGGSDAHGVDDIGRCATFFEKRFSTEAELVAELKAGRFRPDYFRK
ncbi:MAG: PHP-associated domain-containing protein, partial [Chloroflexota bacterium]